MSENSCIYCQSPTQLDLNVLKCTLCKDFVHIKCLKRPGTPGDILGDVFFDFTCLFCSPDGKELFQRQKLQWAVIIGLAVYNLSITSTGLSHHGFFHWKTHIANFVEKNWTYIFGQTFRRKKRWIGSMAGCLSGNCPELFTSGQVVLQEPGWWKLTQHLPPIQFYDLYNKTRKARREQEEEAASETSETSNDDAKKRKMNDNDAIGCSRTIPYMGCTPWHLKTNVQSQENSMEPNDFHEPDPQIHASLMDFLDSVNTDTLLEEELSLTTNTDFLDDLHLMNLNHTDSEWQNMFSSNIDNTIEELPAIEPESQSFEPRIIQVTNFQEDDDDDDEDDIKPQLSDSGVICKKEMLSDNEESTGDWLAQCEKSLFKVTEKRPLPWLNHVSSEEPPCNNHNPENLVLLSEYEEGEMFRSLRSIIEMDGVEVPQWIRRLYRKITIRMKKRELMKPIFDIDNIKKKGRIFGANGHPLLNRFHQMTFLKAAVDQPISMQIRFSGAVQCSKFVSPYTKRILHPFIYRDTKSIPQWVKVMCELQYKVNCVKPSRSSIDYCYVRPQHISAVNSLLQQYFWPGIDMSECLTYPDFSIVALYKNLIVGCAFLVPDVSHNEAYISFMVVRNGWRHAGIATFMLYHLTQTCMGKDITLHVSGTNPAICFYQKFGFKIEEVILDFYEKYLPSDSLKKSRHAFLLRMSR